MPRFNSRNFVYYIFVFIAIFLIFRFLGIVFLIIKGIFFLIIRFWPVFLILWIVWYIYKKLKKKKNMEKENNIRYDDNDKTIEIDDYEIQ